MSLALNQGRSITFTRRADITDPDDLLAWLNLNGTLRDFTGWTLSMEIIDPTTNTIAYTKTAGVFGDNGTGQSNVLIIWTTEEMEPLVGLKRWLGRIIATKDDERSEFVLDARGTLPVWVFNPAPTIPEP